MVMVVIMIVIVNDAIYVWAKVFSCDGGYYDFSNLCVKRERNELDSIIDTIVVVLVPVMAMVVGIRIPYYFLFCVLDMMIMFLGWYGM